jgi:hypothetical protein
MIIVNLIYVKVVYFSYPGIPRTPRPKEGPRPPKSGKIYGFSEESRPIPSTW